MDLEEMIIKSGAVLFGDFTLTSGKKSNYYISIKKAITDPIILKKIAESMSKFVKNEKISGIELGSVPIAVALSLETLRPYVIIRKESKDHGTKDLVEGEIKKGDEIIIVEDVITTGGSIIRAAKILRDYGAIVNRVLVVVDREEGGRENLSKENLELISLIKVSSLLSKYGK
ncbi:MAG: orotate phosphoribosyltransferase [Thermoplasmata archaeon]